MAERTPRPDLGVSHRYFNAHAPREPVGLGWNAAAQPELFLFRRSTCPCAIEYGCPWTSSFLGHLSSHGVCFSSARRILTVRVLPLLVATLRRCRLGCG